MKFAQQIRLMAMTAALTAFFPGAHATNGYFSHGYGMKAKGMGGASIAMTDQAFAGANNPAVAAWAGTRMEVGLDVFMPRRGMARTGSPGALDANIESGSKSFLVPEFAYNAALSDRLGIGIAVYGNGGMNTDYAGGQVNCGGGAANVLCGAGGLGVDLMQLIVAPTVAYKVTDRHSLGVTPLLVYQQFEANGLQAFDNAPGFPPFTGAPGFVTGNGYDRSTGLGVRIGYLGKPNDRLTVGATYSPRTKMGRFNKYAGLFAGAGSFDIPENYGVGASFRATPDLTVALDYQRINYGGVPSIGNPSNPAAAPLGAANGPGFGWSNVNVWKLGVQWQATSRLALRAGFNKGDNPIQARDVTFNIIAPGVTTTHYTLGGTYAVSPATELTLAYMHAPRQSVSGPSLFNGMMGSNATETIRMHQNSIGVQMGWKF
jgi:long-chain fatty acid transport protein